MKYIRNCFWLAAPILVMNLLLADRLPPGYQPPDFSRGVPTWIVLGENFSRLLVFLALFLMPLGLEHARQRTGLILYAAGVLVYFGAWALQIWFPQSEWSRSRLGFMAPAYTPALWLAGIALVGERLYIGTVYRPWMFMALSLVFLAFHNAHVWLAYSRA